MQGWCTLFPVFHWLNWSFVSSGLGKFPMLGHDSRPFAGSPGADKRRELGGKSLLYVACVLFIKGDWAEFAMTLGFASWATKLFPCPFCKATYDDMYDFKGFDALHAKWPPVTIDDIERATSACEVRVRLTRESHARVVAALRYDRRKEGARGRALIVPLPELGLKAGDRLEPSATLLDVGCFDDLTSFPTVVVFWRRRAETRVRHRNPLFDKRIGLTHESLAIDKLHTLYQGPTQTWCATSIWALIEHDVYKVGTDNGVEDTATRALLHIREELWAWYKRRRAEFPLEDITEVENLCGGMIGTAGNPTMKTKACETKGLVPFVCYLLSEHQGQLPQPKGADLLAAGNAMVAYFDLLKESGTVVGDRRLQAMYDAVKRYLRFAGPAGVPFKPKAHALAHMVQRTQRQGNPDSYATFRDEGLNAVLKSIGLVAHRSVWEQRVLIYFEKAQSPQASKRKRS